MVPACLSRPDSGGRRGHRLLTRVPPPPLACSVRACGLLVERRRDVFVCARGHAYDVARDGYVNLLQPQDRRSPDAGDAKSAVEARARLLAAGVGATILDAVVQRAAALTLPTHAAVVDLGSGSGDALAALARTRALTAIGLDLSTAAAAHAARRFPDLTWVVANADRRLPILDGCLDLVLSLHARRHPAECARVLVPGAHLLIAIPAADDLVELRESIMGEGITRDRTEALLAEHQPRFTLVDRSLVREHHTLEREALLDLLRTTYRGGRTSAAARVEALDRLDVTLASEILVLRRR